MLFIRYKDPCVQPTHGNTFGEVKKVVVGLECLKNIPSINNSFTT